MRLGARQVWWCSEMVNGLPPHPFPRFHYRCLSWSWQHYFYFLCADQFYYRKLILWAARETVAGFHRYLVFSFCIHDLVTVSLLLQDVTLTHIPHTCINTLHQWQSWLHFAPYSLSCSPGSVQCFANISASIYMAFDSDILR